MSYFSSHSLRTHAFLTLSLLSVSSAVLVFKGAEYLSDATIPAVKAHRSVVRVQLDDTLGLGVGQRSGVPGRRHLR
ncbi:hypothetical protein A8144_10860 [Mycobacterium leprae 3125609]|nr:hypothetical protein [Mycobacterium leprae]OAR20403.1 hypothetical protein A8144_10860 [Mycobacterium leprae 3125609]OAX70710.1 hypothetical protein A3216_10325 [Mycobacterium leprae 7935681]